jgi:hypothetical protein
VARRLQSGSRTEGARAAQPGVAADVASRRR